jgi:hypothetical protein
MSATLTSGHYFHVVLVERDKFQFDAGIHREPVRSARYPACFPLLQS